MLRNILLLDYIFFYWVNNLPHPSFLVLLAKFFSGFERWFLWSIAVISLIMFQKKHPKLIIKILIGLISSGYLAVGILKPIFGRIRPEFILKNVKAYSQVSGDYLSFPSGHAATAFTTAYLLSKEHPKGKLIFYVLAVLISFSRVYLGVHYLSDVIAGALLGLAIGYLVDKFTGKAKVSFRKAVIVFFLFVFFTAGNASAKTIMTVSTQGIAVYDDSNVLGAQSDEKNDTSFNLTDKQVTVNAIDDKLVAKIEDKGLQGSQEIDQVYVTDGIKGVSLIAEKGKTIITDNIAKIESDLPLILKQKSGDILASLNGNDYLVKYTPSEVKEILTKLKVIRDNSPVKITLTEENGGLIYLHTEKRQEKLFNIIPVNLEVTTKISATTGEINTKTTPWFLKFFKKS